MNKVPLPVAIGVAAVALVILGFTVVSSLGKPAGETGDIRAITAEIMANNPKNAPVVPPELTPAAMAQTMGGGRRGRR